MGQLIYNSEIDRYELNSVELHCGDCFEVLTCDAAGTVRWTETRIKHDGDKWYLVGLRGLCLVGLFARM